MNLALSPIDDRGELINAEENEANSLDTSLEEDAKTILTATSPVPTAGLSDGGSCKLVPKTELSKVGTISLRRK